MDEALTAARFAALLGRPVTATRLRGGRNSRVYVLTDPDGARLLGKAYHHHPDDPRDRLGVEFGALHFLSSRGVQEVPRPIAAAPKERLAVYQFIEGAPISPAEVDRPDIEAALSFVVRLRDLSRRPEARRLPAASEACLSLGGLTDNLERRLERLDRAPVEGTQADVYGAMRRFAADELRPALARLADRARDIYARLGRDPGSEIDPAEQTLSPSDFGFHNARRTPEGRIVWLDFEYFGWDDPAKLAADFVLHPAMGLDVAARRRFVAGIREALAPDVGLPDRMRALFPLFALKWCVILLNEFVRADRLRREFAADAETTVEAALHRQLHRSRDMLKRVTDVHEHFPDLD